MKLTDFRLWFKQKYAEAKVLEGFKVDQQEDIQDLFSSGKLGCFSFGSSGTTGIDRVIDNFSKKCIKIPAAFGIVKEEDIGKRFTMEMNYSMKEAKLTDTVELQHFSLYSRFMKKEPQ
eukprot:11203193-Lingulodinium_polyedra.AAC.1